MTFPDIINRNNYTWNRRNFVWINDLSFSKIYNVTKKEIEIYVIKDFLEGRVFEHWFKFMVSKKAQECDFLDLKDYYMKSLVYLNLMNTLVEDIATMCPIMENFDNRQNLSDKEIAYLKEEMENIDWHSVSIDIVKELETKGDVFYQIYYDKKLKKHRFLKLKSENMLDIIPATDTEPMYYIYRDRQIKRTLENDVIKDKYTDNIIIFTEGYYKIFYDVTSLDITGAKNEVVFNTKEMGDMIPLIHVKGKTKREDSEFSKIPCVDYIDSILYISTQYTDLRTSNRNAGMPRIVAINAQLDRENSVLDAGGIISFYTPKEVINTSSRFLPESNVKSFEITNSLSSVKQEKDDHIDTLYRIVGLIPPSIQAKMSTSDSSKAIAQFRIKQEVKNKHYLKAIRNSFSEFFSLLLMDKFKNKKKRDKIYLQIPDILVTSGVYDELLLTAQKINLGLTNIKNHLKDNGYSDESINELLKNSREVMENNIIEKPNTTDNKIETEIKVEDESNLADNSSGVDNRLKKSKN